MHPLRSPSTLPVLLVALVACAAPVADDPAPPAAHPAPDPLAATPAPAPTSTPEPASRPQATAAPADELRFTPQPGWVVEAPTSSMRKAQYKLPGVDGAKAAALVVFHFGPGGGGGIEANVERWAGQFEQPDGSDSRAALRQATRTQRGRTITEVELAGTYVAETSPGSGERVREEGWRMLAAILEAPEGAYYAKLVGPTATVERWRASYRSFLDAVEP